MSVTPLLLSSDERLLLAELLDRSVSASAPSARMRQLANLRARLDHGGDQIVAQVNASSGVVLSVDANAPLACIWSDWDAGDTLALCPTGPLLADLSEHTATVRPDVVMRAQQFARNALPMKSDGYALFITQNDQVLAARAIASIHDHVVRSAIADAADVTSELGEASFVVHLVHVQARNPTIIGTHIHPAVAKPHASVDDG